MLLELVLLEAKNFVSIKSTARRRDSGRACQRLASFPSPALHLLLAYALDACHIVVLANGEESTESGRFGSALRLDRRAPELLEPLRTVRTDRRALVLLITLVYTLL